MIFVGGDKVYVEKLWDGKLASLNKGYDDIQLAEDLNIRALLLVILCLIKPLLRF